MRETGSPPTVTLPPLGLYTRVMTLNSVVLPAPLGPIRATTSPASTVKETRSSATTPPKRTLSSRISSSAISAQVYCELARLANTLLAQAGLAARRARPEFRGAQARQQGKVARAARARRQPMRTARAGRAPRRPTQTARAAAAQVRGQRKEVVAVRAPSHPTPTGWAAAAREPQAQRRSRRSNPAATPDAPPRPISAPAPWDASPG